MHVRRSVASYKISSVAFDFLVLLLLLLLLLFIAVVFAPGGSSPTLVQAKTMKQRYTIITTQCNKT
jgi:hypothetical protein